jgi:hypothetical protein
MKNNNNNKKCKNINNLMKEQNKNMAKILKNYFLNNYKNNQIKKKNLK